MMVTPWNRQEKQGMVLAILIHAAALILMIFSGLLSAFKPEPEPPHVFELVAEVPATPSPQPQPRETQEDPAAQPMDLPPIETVQPRPIPDLPEPPPEPVREPEPEPAPVEAAEPAERVTIEEFLQRQGRPETARPRPRSTQPRVTPGRIDVSQVQAALRNLAATPTESNRVDRLSDADQRALAGYMAGLRSRLNQVWNRPGVASGLYCEVEFWVQPDGRISGFNIRRSSGSALLNQSVKDAFEAYRSIGPTPTGQAHQFILPFRIK
ncbi:MAG: TonB family protein [Opitutales bacterium]